MAKSLKLLLVENVESLGIVGDVVNVRTGYARNFLMPRALATVPSDEKIKELAGKRAAAQKLLEVQRGERVSLNDKLKGVELTLTRACNDQGILYGAVTQQELAAALKELGHIVSPRDVRITQAIKRVDNYDVHIKLDADLDSIIKVHVKADRELHLEAKGQHPEETPAGGAGAGPDEAPRKRRDPWALPDDSNRVVGWGTAKKEEKSEEAKADSKKTKAAKGEKRAKDEAAEAGGEAKPEAKAETKAEAKAEKPAKAPKAEGGDKKSKKKAE